MIPRRFSLLCLGALAVLGGCKRPEIRVYTAPKEEELGASSGGAAPSALGGERAKPKIAYQTPEGWTLTPGGQLSLANFIIEGEGGKATVSITALGNLAGREDSLVNMWREQVGAEPLPKEAAAKALTPVRVAGWPGQLFEVNGTKEGRASRIVTAIVNRPEGTWFFKLAGDEMVVQAQKGTFADFLRDFQFVEADAATPEVAETTHMPAAAGTAATPAPVAAPAATPVPTQTSTSVASIPLATPAPAGPAVVPVPAPAPEVTPVVPVSPMTSAPLMTRPIPLSVEAPAPSDKPAVPVLPVAPTSPAPPVPAPATPVPVPATPVPVPATPVPVPVPPVSPAPQSAPVPAPTPAAEPAPPANASSGWKIPPAWQQLEPGQMQVAKFSVPDQGSAKAVVSVSVFGGDTGGTLGNVNRWRGQLGLEPVDEAGLAGISQPLPGAGAVLADFAKENRRLVGAIVPRGGQWWFYKLVGEGPAVEAAKAAFLDFVQAPPPGKVE